MCRGSHFPAIVGGRNRVAAAAKKSGAPVLDEGTLVKNRRTIVAKIGAGAFGETYVGETVSQPPQTVARCPSAHMRHAGTPSFQHLLAFITRRNNGPFVTLASASTAMRFQGTQDSTTPTPSEAAANSRNPHATLRASATASPAPP
ncbi:hypothetical protein DIPPA_14242 [Diplonema papillatum]|nr:hypothetical protein DIPPA_14242 [Diplonema papillatum]